MMMMHHIPEMPVPLQKALETKCPQAPRCAAQGALICKLIANAQTAPPGWSSTLGACRCWPVITDAAPGRPFI